MGRKEVVSFRFDKELPLNLDELVKELPEFDNRTMLAEQILSDGVRKLKEKRGL